MSILLLQLRGRLLWDDERLPSEILGIRVPPVRAAPLGTLLVFLYDIPFLEDNVLPFPVLHHAQGLECAHNVVGINGHFLAKILDGYLLAREGADMLQQDIFPIRPVGDETQIREGLLRRSDFPLRPCQEITEIDE